MTDLLAQLTDDTIPQDRLRPLCRQAAAEIERLMAAGQTLSLRMVKMSDEYEALADERDRLRAALKPFAAAGSGLSAKHGDLHGARSTITLADLRLAEEALADEQSARRCEHGLHPDNCGKCSTELEIK